MAISPTVARVLDQYAETVAFAAYTPGTLVKSKFGEPVRLFICVGRFASQAEAEAKLNDSRKSEQIK